jgi:nucleotide-binding universal stress UspA family protein
MADRKTLYSRTERLVVIVGIDFEATGDQAFNAAWEVTRGRDAEIHLLHALGKEPIGTATARRLVVLQSKLEKNGRRLRSYVEKRGLEPAERRGNLSLHVRFGAPDRALIQLAVDVNADLIVVGSRSLRGMQKLLLGSVGGSVAKRAPCAVLVARPKNFTGMAHTQGIEPPCKACLARRTDTAGAEWWCARHAHRNKLPLHVYSYRRELSLETHSNI